MEPDPTENGELVPTLKVVSQATGCIMTDGDICEVRFHFLPLLADRCRWHRRQWLKQRKMYVDANIDWNSIVHGGSIIAGMQTIPKFEDVQPLCVAKWCRTFGGNYRSSFKHTQTYQLPELIRKVMNQHASVLSLRNWAWRLNGKFWDQIIELPDHILSIHRHLRTWKQDTKSREWLPQRMLWIFCWPFCFLFLSSYEKPCSPCPILETAAYKGLDHNLKQLKMIVSISIPPRYKLRI